MSDDLRIKQPQDPRTINTHETWELDYWSKKFGVTKEKLLKTINDVGSNSVEEVEKELNG
jgi:hypothetical protein